MVVVETYLVERRRVCRNNGTAGDGHGGRGTLLNDHHAVLY